MRTIPFSFLVFVFILLIAACGPSLKEQSEARLMDTIADGAAQNASQQSQLLNDLRTSHNDDLAHINALQAQNMTLVAQMALQQETLTRALQDTIHTQNNVILLLTLLVGALVIAVLALGVFVLLAHRRRAEMPMYRHLPAARGYAFLPDGQIRVIDPEPRSAALVPYRDQ